MISVVNSVQDVELALWTVLRYDLKCLVIVSQCEMTTMIYMNARGCVELEYLGLSFIIVRCVLHELRLLLPGV